MTAATPARRGLAGIITTAILLAGCAAGAGPTAPTPSGERPQRGGGADNGIQPYAEVVAGTQADSGLFVVHRSDEKLLFEIPDVAERVARILDPEG